MVHLGSHCINIQISEHSGRIFKDIYLEKCIIEFGNVVTADPAVATRTCPMQKLT